MCPCILKAFCAPLVWPVWDRSELVAKAFNNSNKSHDSKKSHGNTKSSCSLTETQGAETWRWRFCAWQNSVLLAEVLQGTTPSPIFLSIRAFGIYPWRRGSTRKKTPKRGGNLSWFHLWCSGSCWWRWSSTCIWLGAWDLMCRTPGDCDGLWHFPCGFERQNFDCSRWMRSEWQPLQAFLVFLILGAFVLVYWSVLDSWMLIWCFKLRCLYNTIISSNLENWKELASSQLGAVTSRLFLSC